MQDILDGAQADRRTSEEVPLSDLLAEDFRANERRLTSPGFWAIAAHRLGARAQAVRPKPARLALSAAHKVLATTVDWVWGIHIPARTHVGRRVHIWHFGSLLLNARSIGNDVHIRHDTTFGPVRAQDRDRLEALPVIEDAVDIGSGACVMGGVTVGQGAKIGANSVVLEPVPPGMAVFGVPARIFRVGAP